MLVRLACVAVVAVLTGCATPRLDDPPLALELVVTGLRQDEREELRDRVCAIDGVSDCLLVKDPGQAPASPRKGKRGKKGKDKDAEEEAPPPPAPSPQARITFSYRGSLGNLRWRIAQVPHPGLEAARADVRLSYRGFDNKAPSVEIIEPADRMVVAEKSIRVQVRVPDVDTAAVDIGEERAVRDGIVFSATISEMHEGENPILIKAVDQAGNAYEQTIVVEVDTTPPGLEVEVQILAYDKALVKGKVTNDVDKLTVDGRDVSADLFGGFEKEVSVDPDKTTTEIVAIDAYGNAKRIKRSVKVASPMSDSSK